jgi:hypothetical protein
MKTLNSPIETVEPRLTANDLRLKRYLEIDSQVKELTKELESLKEELTAHRTLSFSSTKWRGPLLLL